MEQLMVIFQLRSVKGSFYLMAIIRRILHSPLCFGVSFVEIWSNFVLCFATIPPPFHICQHDTSVLQCLPPLHASILSSSTSVSTHRPLTSTLIAPQTLLPTTCGSPFLHRPMLQERAASIATIPSSPKMHTPPRCLLVLLRFVHSPPSCCPSPSQIASRLIDISSSRHRPLPPCAKSSASARQPSSSPPRASDGSTAALVVLWKQRG